MTDENANDPRFVQYYAEASVSPAAVERSVRLRDLVLSALDPQRQAATLDVADIGCGAGAQSFVWSDRGHRVHGVDVSAALIELARERARDRGVAVTFDVGSAAALPWGRASMDVCLLSELLEHVPEWARCLDECARVLRPGGVLYLSTTNTLCPVQSEYELPLYSWYPARLKSYYARLAATTRPELANYATFPAVNWFSPYSLARELRRRGFESLDRFDVARRYGETRNKRVLGRVVSALPPLRWLGHVATPYSLVIARRL